MNSRIYKLSIFLILGATAQWSAAQNTPNIVVILADDYGYGSANCYGASEKHIKTPNINRLAEEGMRFTDANTPASVCSPTRYAFLTGRYAWRGVMKHSVLSPPEGPLAVEPELFTLPEYLKEKGYRSAQFGKWHLGYTNLEIVKDLSAQPLEPGPRSMGFDYTFAVPNQIDWLPKIYVENESIWGLRSKGKHPYGKSFYKGQQYHGYDAPQRVAKNVTQDLSDHAKEWLEKTVKEDPDKPFFLYFCPVAVHHPISPSDKFSGTSGVGAYGDFIHDLDNSVGEIVNKLESLGVLDNTLLIFTSDNGGDFCPEEKEARALGFKVNGDFKGDKHLIWQGGFKVPFVARWPKIIKAGSQSDRMINIVDLYATFQELLDGKVMDPETAAPDSFSFYSALCAGKSAQRERPSMMMNDVKGTLAVRMEDWKYIENNPLRPADKAQKERNPARFKPQLFNLKQDPAEEHDVISEYPEIAERMQKKLDRIRAEGSERMTAD